MSKQETGKQDEKKISEKLSPLYFIYPPGHYPDPVWIASKVLAVIKKVLERRKSGVFTKD